ADVGTAKPVAVSLTTSGADAGNYAVATSASTVADITAPPPPVVTPPAPAPAPVAPISTQTPTPTLASALVSLPNLPSGFDLASSLTFGTPSSIDISARTPISADSVTTATDPAKVSSVVSGNTRENLLVRRTFAIGDGGMRLPAGVVGSDKDAAP
ncbi:MAG: hypothetical protein JWQ11_2461, partial [Rhizobacter sp.]|nr:hypothetical protein [Rhizobacter sp.]